MFFNKNDNKRKILSIVDRLVSDYDDPFAPCKDIVMQGVQKLLDSLKDDKRECSLDEIVNLAHVVLNNVLYVNLGTGRYHLYTGILNPIGHTMFAMVIRNNDWQLEHNQITQEEYDNILENLRESIKEVG